MQQKKQAVEICYIVHIALYMGILTCMQIKLNVVTIAETISNLILKFSITKRLTFVFVEFACCGMSNKYNLINMTDLYFFSPFA